MANVVKGKAVIEGIPGTFDVILYPVGQSLKVAVSHDQEDIKDIRGMTCSSVARDQHLMADYAMKILGDTKAHAAAGVAILAPLATVVFTADSTQPTTFDGSYSNQSGQDIDFGNTKVSDMTIKLRKFTDSTQNAAMIVTPS